MGRPNRMGRDMLFFPSNTQIVSTEGKKGLLCGRRHKEEREGQRKERSGEESGNELVIDRTCFR